MSPVPEGEVVVDCLSEAYEDGIDHVGIERVLDENDGSHKGRFQRLLGGQLQGKVDKGVAQLFILVVIAQQASDGLHFGVPLAKGRVGDTE